MLLSRNCTQTTRTGNSERGDGRSRCMVRERVCMARVREFVSVARTLRLRAWGGSKQASGDPEAVGWVGEEGSR